MYKLIRTSHIYCNWQEWWQLTLVECNLQFWLRRKTFKVEVENLFRHKSKLPDTQRWMNLGEYLYMTNKVKNGRTEFAISLWGERGVHPYLQNMPSVGKSRNHFKRCRNASTKYVARLTSHPNQPLSLSVRRGWRPSELDNRNSLLLGCLKKNVH